MAGVAPVNPAEFMQDVLINEAMRKPAVTKEQQIESFRQMLLEEVFLRDMFANETSIYKPDPEELGDEDLNLGKNMTGIYSGYARKELAAYLIEQGFLRDAITIKDIEK